MQHNFLSNYCLFFFTMQTGESFKMLSLLHTVSVQRLPPKEIQYSAYEGRRETKQALRPKEKNLRTQFDLTVIKDQDVLFLYNRERSQSDPRGGHTTISSREFFEILQRNRLIGDLSLLKTVKLSIQSLLWENYTISHVQVGGGRSLIIIQEIFSSTLFNTNREEHLLKKPKLLFQPLLELMLGGERAAGELERFQKQLRTMKALHPQLERQIDKEKAISEINYCLIYYLSILQALREADPSLPQ